MTEELNKYFASLFMDEATENFPEILENHVPVQMQKKKKPVLV